jgi:methyltransferase FkbM-like protein
LLRAAPGQFCASAEEPRGSPGAVDQLEQFRHRRPEPDLGRNNCGEASFYDVGEQSTITVEVETRAPSALPKAHIVKIDTEGSEIDILSGMTSLDFDVIMLEYHSEANRRKADELLEDFLLVGGEIRSLHRGTLKYFHRRLVKAAGLLVPGHVG